MLANDNKVDEPKIKRKRGRPAGVKLTKKLIGKKDKKKEVKGIKLVKKRMDERNKVAQEELRKENLEI